MMSAIPRTDTPSPPEPAQRLDELAGAAQRGDHEAFAQLMHATWGELHAFIAARSPTSVGADELVQDTFVIAFRRLDRYQPRGTLLCWLKGIARLRLCEVLRQHQRERRAAADTLGAILADRCEQRCAAEQHLANEDASFEQEALRRCLAALAPRARQLISRRYLEAIPAKRLAQQFKITTDAVTAQLQRIRKHLRTCLNRNGVET